MNESNSGSGFDLWDFCGGDGAKLGLTVKWVEGFVGLMREKKENEEEEEEEDE